MRVLLAEVFEERLHGVVVGPRQLLDQVLDGLNSMLVVCDLCTREESYRYARTGGFWVIFKVLRWLI